MNLPELGVKRPTAVTMFFLSMLILGIIALIKLPIDFFPNIEPPAISIITAYPGASAKDIENKVTKFIENDLSIINNLDSISSISKENFSVITCKFFFGTNLDEASNDIRSSLDFTRKKLPNDIEDPLIFKFNTSFMPIFFMGITARENYINLYDIADKDISDHLKRIPGVGAVQIFGGLKRQINIKLNPYRMYAYNLTIDQIENTLKAENVTFPAGSIKVGTMEFFIRVPGEYKTTEEIGNIIVNQHRGALVYLKDIAQIEDGTKESKMSVSVDKNKGLIMFIQKRSGANSVVVVDKVQEKLKELRKNLPEDVSVSVISDTTEMIRNSIKNLERTMIFVIITVAFVILLLLRNFRSSLIIAVTIPFSLITALIYLYLTNNSINIISLSSIVIVIGMVVDNAIVILENITRHLEKGEKPFTAAIHGSMEVAGAITASSLTTIIIFLPLIFTSGMIGIMFRQMAYIVTITIFASLITALTLTPMLSSKFLKLTDKNKITSVIWKRIYTKSEEFFAKLETHYTSFIKWALKHRKRVIFSYIGIFISSFLLLPLIGTSFIPESDPGQLELWATLPIGTNIDKSQIVADQIEDILKKVIKKEELIHTYYRAGSTELGIAAAFGEKEGTHIINAGAKLVKSEKRKRSSKEIAIELKKELIKIPEIIKLDIDPGSSMAKMFMGMGKPISVDIIGHDLNKTDEIARNLKSIMLNIEGPGDVNISRETGTPEISINIDRQKASSLGLNMAVIGQTLRSYFFGKAASKFRESSDEHDIYLQLNEDYRKDFTDIMEITIPSLTGRRIKLKNIATITETTGPTEIERKDKERVIRVESNIYGKRSLGEIESDIRKEISKLNIPKDITIQFGGEIEEKKEAFKDLFLLLLLALILVYMVLAGQFESLRDPFIIMFSVPFAFVGVFIFLFITRTAISIISFIGMIMITGIVVNNAIVLIDYINLLRKRGDPVYDAIVNGCRARLRPIIITSLTTVVGLLPLILLRGEGSSTWRPLGITLFGGLSLSSFVTLIFVPIVYSIFEQKSE